MRPWWTEERAIRRRVEDRTGSLPDSLWQLVWRDFGLEADDEAAAETDLAHLVRECEKYLAAASFQRVQVRAVRGRGRHSQQPAKAEPTVDRFMANLERALWLLTHDRQVRAVRELIGPELLDGERAIWWLTSPILARHSPSDLEWRRIPPVHRAWPVNDYETLEQYWQQKEQRLRNAGTDEATARHMVDERRRHRVLFFVEWDSGSRLVELERVPRLGRFSSPRVRFPLDGGTRAVLIEPYPIWHGSVLDLTFTAAHEVETTTGLPMDWALSWLLTGTLPDGELIGWVGASYSFGQPFQIPLVSLTVIAGLPEALVLRAYRQTIETLRELWRVPDTLLSPRSLSERTLALARFWHEEVERAGREPSFEALRREWNRRYPAWSYRHRASFWRALCHAVGAVYGIALPAVAAAVRESLRESRATTRDSQRQLKGE